jgi:hypothetical protein
MGVNDFNIPREREIPFYKMMDEFFDQLSDTIKNEKTKLKEEEVKAQAPLKKDEKEIHIHVHTEGAKKEDPNAKVRNRGKVVFPAGSKKVKDNKDHFPINDANQARDALSRVAQYSSVPPWYDGTLEELQSAVRNAVKRAYPGIKVTTDKKSKGEEIAKQGNQIIQILFNKEIYDIKSAQRWLRDQGYYYDKFNLAGDFIRFQQRDYRMYDSGTFKVINLAENIKAVTADPVKKIGDV